MLEIYDDDFIDRYEAALIIYDSTYGWAEDLMLRRFPHLPHIDAEWALVNATSLGGGFHKRTEGLYWFYPEGAAISVEGFVLRGLEAREFFNSILRRWRRNR